MEPTIKGSPKEVLLRALEWMEAQEQEVGAEVRHVCVVYSAVKPNPGGSVSEAGGFNHSDDPPWLVAALLRRAADAIEAAPDVDPDDP